MKHRKRLGMVLILIISMFVVGCGSKESASKEDEALKISNNKEEEHEVRDIKEDTNSEDADLSSGQDSDQDMEDKLEIMAKKEGISVKELEKTLDALADLGAEKYGISKSDYISTLEDSGSSVLEEWTEASEMMGISITELYEDEKTKMANRTDEEKATLAGMAEALEEVSDIDLEQLEGEANINAMLGIEENTSGEIRLAQGDFGEDFYYKADEIAFEYKDEYSITVEYYSNDSIDDILAYYIALLENTKNYTLLTPYESPGGMIQGYYDKTDVYVEVLESEDDGRTYVTNYLDLSSRN